MLKFFKFKKAGGQAKPKEPKPPKAERKPSEFEKYFFHRFEDRKEYKQRRMAFAAEAAPVIIDGCGGIKNIVAVKVFNYSVIITFRNLYQIKEDVLKTTGGLRLKIQDHTITDIFDFTEAKAIVAIIKKELKTARSMLVKMDLA